MLEGGGSGWFVGLAQVPFCLGPTQSPTTPLHTVILLKPQVSVSSITPVRETHSIALYRNLSHLNSYNLKR